MGFKLFRQLLTVNKRAFVWAVATEVMMVLLFDLCALVIGPLLCESIVQKDVGHNTVYLIAAGAALCYAVRNFAQSKGFQAVQKVKMTGTEELIKRISSFLRGGFDRNSLIPEGGVFRVVVTHWGSFVDTLLLQVLTTIVTLLTSVGLLCIKAPLLLIPFTVVSILFAVLMQRGTKKSYDVASELATAETWLLGHVDALLGNRTMAWLFDRINAMMLESLNPYKVKADADFNWRRQRRQRLRWFEWTMYVCALGYVLYKYSDTSIPRSEVAGLSVLLILLVNILGDRLIGLALNISMLHTYVGGSETVSKALLQKTPRKKQLPKTKDETSHVITLRGVVKRDIAYPDITIRSGSIWILPQRIGWGKTTLELMLSGIELPDEGDILVNGCSTRDYDITSEVVTVAQELPPEVSMAHLLQGQGMEQVRYAAPKVNLELSEVSHEFRSGGLRRQAYLLGAIAHFVTHGAIAFLLDEPTTSLDGTSIAALAKGLHQIQADYPHLIIIIASHDERMWRLGEPLFPKETP